MIHCLGINLRNIRVLWDHIWLNSYRFLTAVVREMWSDRVDSVFYSLIGRSILMNWAFAQQLGVLIPQRDICMRRLNSHMIHKCLEMTALSLKIYTIAQQFRWKHCCIHESYSSNSRLKRMLYIERGIIIFQLSQGGWHVWNYRSVI